MAGRHQIQALAAGLQADQEHRRAACMRPCRASCLCPAEHASAALLHCNSPQHLQHWPMHDWPMHGSVH